MWCSFSQEPVCTGREWEVELGVPTLYYPWWCTRQSLFLLFMTLCFSGPETLDYIHWRHDNDSTDCCLAALGISSPTFKKLVYIYIQVIDDKYRHISFYMCTYPYLSVSLSSITYLSIYHLKTSWVHIVTSNWGQWGFYLYIIPVYFLFYIKSSFTRTQSMIKLEYPIITHLLHPTLQVSK